MPFLDEAKRQDICEIIPFGHPHPKNKDGNKVLFLMITTIRGHFEVGECQRDPRGEYLSFYKVSKPEAMLLARMYLRDRPGAAESIRGFKVVE